MKSAIIFALVAVVAATEGKVVEIKESEANRPAPWYSCSGKQPGNYLHPRDCTRFISCDAGLEAWERDCASCANEPNRCTPEGRLVYDDVTDACQWPEDTTCHSRETPEPTTTQAPENPENPPKAGDPCDPENCRNIGECQHYLRCDKQTEKWVEEQCGDGMFWNPDSGAIHGGNCDELDNLSPEVERRYRSDPECLQCFWKETGECQQKYLYQPPNQNNRNVLTLSCSNGLVFVEAKETCQRCSDVQRKDGSACCSN